MKYNYFHLEQRKGGKSTSEFHPSKLYYNKEGDYFICPIGQKMNKYKIKHETTNIGYTKEIHVYYAQNCNGCNLRGACHKSKSNRRIEVNHKLNKRKEQAKRMLTSDEGKKHQSQRPADVEAVFGNIKQNRKFTRFYLRGKEKIDIEIGLVYLSHNLAKLAKVS